MNPHARGLLEELLEAADRASAGVRVRAPALTESHLAAYRSTHSLEAKESLEAALQDAQAQGAVELQWDDPGRAGFIKRVAVKDAATLASFLGKRTAADVIDLARQALEPHAPRFPVLEEVLRRWARLRKVRGLGPESAAVWIDSIAVIDFARQHTVGAQTDMPIRRASAQLFADSKRIENLHAPIDVLLVGDLEAAARPTAQVWGEIGLYREEQAVRLAGRVIMKRERVTSVLDIPYAGFSPTTVLGLGSQPSGVLTIENQTNFHVHARAHHDDQRLVIYSAGMPTPAWRKMYATILRDLPVGATVHHWGDLDEGGFRIAWLIARDAIALGHTLRPWKMSPDDVPHMLRRKAKSGTIQRMARYARLAGWEELARKVEAAGITVEQEALLN